MASFDVYGRTGELDKNILDAIAARLEARRSDKRYMAMLHDYLDLIPLSEVKNALCLGSGTGVEVRELLLRDDFQGTVTALDVSSELIEFGKASFIEEGIEENTCWVVADAANTGLTDSSFDLIVLHTLFSHVPSPNNVITEIARLLEQSGTVVIFDGDYATMTFGTEDPEAGKEMDEKIIQIIVANPRVMRSMPRMLSNAGFQLMASKGWVLTEIGKADFFSGSLDSFPILLPKGGLITKDEAESFVAEQREASEKGEFFAGYNFYAMIARFSDA